MSHKKIFTSPFRRKREGKTNYRKRQSLLKSGSLRLVVRKSNKHMVAQLIKYNDDGDVVVNSAHSKELKSYGWDINTGNIPAAYLTGFLIGKKSEGQKAILDLGLQTPIQGSRIFAVLKGASDGGLKIKFSDDVLPKEDRLSGNHISDYASKIKKEKEIFSKRFSQYLKNKKDPEKVQEYLEKAKENISKNGQKKK